MWHGYNFKILKSLNTIVKYTVFILSVMLVYLLILVDGIKVRISFTKSFQLMSDTTVVLSKILTSSLRDNQIVVLVKVLMFATKDFIMFLNPVLYFQT